MPARRLITGHHPELSLKDSDVAIPLCRRLAHSESLLFDRAILDESTTKSKVGRLATGLMFKRLLLGYTCTLDNQSWAISAIY